MTAAAPKAFRTPAEVVAALRHRRERIVAIDGWTGAGKSHLAGAIGPPLGRVIVEVDAFRTAGPSAYLESLDLLCLSKVLARERKLVVAGSCLRDVLERTGGGEAVHLYVMRMDRQGWRDEAAIEGGEAGPGGFEEMRLYHRSRKPHDRADFLFERF